MPWTKKGLSLYKMVPINKTLEKESAYSIGTFFV